MLTGVELDEQRRRRTETSIQIRKEKKDDQIQKRRVWGFNFFVYEHLNFFVLFIALQDSCGCELWNFAEF